MKGISCLIAMTVVLGQFGAEAQGETQTHNGRNAPLEFILHPVVEGFSSSPHDTPRSTEVVFKKEPDYAGSTVHRHTLQISDAPSDFIGMAYDATANLLYIDHNRNLDLTDDGPAIPGDGSGYWDGEFSDVAIELIHDGLAVPYLLDISILGGYYCSATVKSGWQGTVEIAGQPCVIGVADNLDGRFDFNDSFRFDHEGHREARLPFGDAQELPLPRWLHFEGQNYAIDSAFRVVDGETALAVTLTPITEDLMDVAFEGQFVSHILLRGRDMEYGLLDWPAPEMRIPSGTYTPHQVALLDSFTGRLRQAQRLEAGGNTLLKTGGPLRQHVSVRRSGATLSLDYTLLGVDETEYSPNKKNDTPRFAVYSGDRKVGQGQFEYG